MGQECNISALVVVYNTRCGESPTCRALDGMEDGNLRVLIYDNSTADYGNAEYCRRRGWTYLGGQGNVGLSKAYNACIDYLASESVTGFLCLFDDDTDLSGDYFRQLREAAAEGGHIFVPLVYSAGKLLSPCLINAGHRTRLFPDTESALTYAGDSMTAINSGMAVDLSVFREYRYDERIFLDGVDHTFLMDMKRSGEKIHVFPYRCDHSFSGNERPPMDAAMTRFRIYAADYRYILRGKKWAYWCLVGKRALRLSAQYHSPAFIRELFA